MRTLVISDERLIPPRVIDIFKKLRGFSSHLKLGGFLEVQFLYF